MEGESRCERPESDSVNASGGPASPSRRPQLGSRTTSLKKTPSRRHLQRPASNRKIGRRVGTDDEARLSRTGSSTKLVSSSSSSKVSPSKTPRAQPNYQKTKSFRRSHSIRSSKTENNGDDADGAVELLSQSSRRLLLSCSSRDFNVEEESAGVVPQIHRTTSVRKRNENIAQVDWKKEVLNEATPDSPEHETTCSPTKNALTKVARIFSSSEGSKV